jgi:hypothetical protein
MNKERAQARLDELKRSRDALAALFDFMRLEGMIAAYEEMMRDEESA